MMDVFRQLFIYLPPPVADALQKSEYDLVTEIRFSINKPVLVSNQMSTYFLTSGGNRKIISDKAMFDYMLEKLTGGSIYSVNENIKEGFVTVKGGHRVGMCGTAVRQGEGVSYIKHISSLCFRVSREVRGSGLGLINEIEGKNGLNNILIASPPGCGKTTVLRDLCRIIANGELTCGIKRVGIADERGEIAAVNNGVAAFDVGVASFVCDGYSKSHAMLTMLRSMSPDLIATDEIGMQKDFEAVHSALKSGVSVIATAHAGDLQDLLNRFGKEVKSFDKIVFLKNKGSIARIYRRLSGDY